MTSQTPNATLMAEARASLAGKWKGAAIVTLVYMLIICGLQLIPFIGLIISLAITGPMLVGLYRYMLQVSRGGNPDLNVLFSGTDCIGKAIGVYFLTVLIIMVGMMLLIVPCVYASFALALVFFVLANSTKFGVVDVLKQSHALMKGNMWKLFCLYCRFIGWMILGALTLGIGFLWVLPYLLVSVSKFYDEVKGAEAA